MQSSKHYFFYFSRYLDKETANRPFQSSSQAATCYYQSNHSKVETFPLSDLAEDTISKLAGLSSYYLVLCGANKMN